ncbi:MAG: hypothetical protein OXF08_08130 [Bacteroidetes bacterium]|nr:hypothetical protein [Bacteroidota bacterium]
MKIISRTVTLIKPEHDPRYGQNGLSLKDFDSDLGYVLLGEPGMGKSTAFHIEADRIPEAYLISARKFFQSNLNRVVESPIKTIFIDGLDEMRFGGGEPQFVIDKIITIIKALGTPKIRLSCQFGNYLCSDGLKQLGALFGSQEILILQLNPIKQEDIQDIVSQSDVDEQVFFEKALPHPIEVFRGNPLLLNLLITSVKHDVWPKTHLKILESACQALIKDQDLDHNHVYLTEHPPSSEALIHAAGLLCATMLIANKIGWAVNESKDSDVLSLIHLEDTNKTPHATAMNSRIFEGPTSKKIPIHRHLAEFLGARYLNDQINEGCNVRRVIALLIGYNGTLWPDLEGLAGWLTTLNDQARAIMIDIAPTTVASSGDPEGLNVPEREKLFLNLEQQIHHWSDAPSAIAVYATLRNEAIPTNYQLLDWSNPSENRQLLAQLYIRGITQFLAHRDREEVAILYDRLLNMIQDHRWISKVRCEALLACDKIAGYIDNPRETLTKILRDVKENKISDEAHDLIGTLLFLLYPNELQPAELWDYIVIDSMNTHNNRYIQFFTNLIDQSSERHVRELIDSLCECVSVVVPKLQKQKLAGIVIDILARALELFGDQLSIKQLYQWLKIVEYDHHTSQLIPVHSSPSKINQYDDANSLIRGWLSQRDRLQYDLIDYGLLHTEKAHTNDCLFQEVAMKILGLTAPDGFRLWCLTRSMNLWDSNPNVAKELASWSVRAQEGWGLPLSDEEVIKVISCSPELVQWNDQRLNEREKSKRGNAQIKAKQEKIKTLNQKQKQDKLKAIREQKTELAKGQCPPIILDELANIYFNNPNTEENIPRRCLIDYFEGDEALVQSTLTGFQSLLHLDQLPDLRQIVQLYEEGHKSYFALPFLAAMEEAYQTRKDINQFSAMTILRALGFYLTTKSPQQQYTSRKQVNDIDHIPLWYDDAIKSFPKYVAQVLVSLHNANVRSKKPPHAHMFEMAFDPAYAHIAKMAVQQMFTVFPSRCSARKLESLRVVLWSAIVNNGLAVRELNKMISRRLKRKKMDLGQQAQWLSAGLFADSKVYLPRLSEYLSTAEESRLRHVVDFLIPEGQYKRIIFHRLSGWNPKHLCQIIQVLVRGVHPPISQESAGNVNDDQVVSHKFQTLLNHLIGEIKKDVTDDAMKALNKLASDPSLSAWKPEIVLAQEEQQRHYRAVKHSDLSVLQIHQILHQREASPVNAPDLLILTLEALEEFVDQISRHSITGQQFWTYDAEQSIEPLSETKCSEELIIGIQQNLKKYKIELHLVEDSTNHRRHHVNASYGSNLSIPIIVRKNSSRDLWRAMTEQLVQQTTRHLKSYGYGIYVVFWYGADRKYMKVVPPEGGTPKDSSQLKNTLEKRLTPELRKRIQVVVIDVSSIKPSKNCKPSSSNQTDQESR